MVSSVWCRSCTKKSKAKTGEFNTFLVQPCHPLIYNDSAKPKSGDPDYSKLTWLELAVQWKILERLDNFKTSDFNELHIWACNMVMWYWPVDTMFWQVNWSRHWCSIYLRSYPVNQGCMSQSTYYLELMATILYDSNAAVAIILTRSREILLAMITTRKLMGSFLSYMSMGQ